MEVQNIVQEVVSKTIPKKKKCKKAKWLSEEALQKGLLRKEEKRKAKEKRKQCLSSFERRVPKNSKERYESLLQ